jgi:hypothetical protein
MRRLFDIGFLIAIALACVGLDFYILKRDHGDQAFGLAQYIAQRKGDVQDMLKPPSLAAALPSDIVGWDLYPNGADQILQGSAESRAQQASEVALVKAVEALEKANHPKGEIVGMIMTKGDTRLRMVSVLHKDETFQAAVETAIAQFGAETSPLQAIIESQPAAVQAAAYSVVDGVAFAELPAAAISGHPDLRLLRAQIGQELSVTFITKSTDDAAIRQAMQGIDFVALNKLLQLPLSGVVDGRTTDARFDPENLNNNFVARLQGSLPSPQVGAVPTPSDEAGITKAMASSAVKTGAQPIAESTEFIAPPDAGTGFSGQPCVRRAGVLQCPEG